MSPPPPPPLRPLRLVVAGFSCEAEAAAVEWPVPEWRDRLPRERDCWPGSRPVPPELELRGGGRGRSCAEEAESRRSTCWQIRQSRPSICVPDVIISFRVS